MVRITSDAIDTQTAYDLLEKNGTGSVVLHFAVVKPQEGALGGTTSHIEFGTSGDAAAELEVIAAELQQEFSLDDVLLTRRIGRVALGEVISLVAASSPGSDNAFAACKAGIGRLKKMRSIVKNEVCA